MLGACDQVRKVNEDELGQKEGGNGAKHSKQWEQHLQKPCGREAWCLGGRERRALPPVCLLYFPLLGYLLLRTIPSLLIRSFSILQS